MCGRFALGRNRNQIRHDVEIDEWIDEEVFVPRYNIAPRTQAPVIRRGDRVGGNNDGIVLQTMKWGLVPHWSKFEDKTLSTTNARSENLVEGGGGMWASIKGKKRCAIPCQGYYEWLTKGKDKLPHFTKRKDGKLLLMAGLYDCAILEGKRLWTFSIVTTDANKEFSWLHERQPVFLTSKEVLNRWLDTSSQSWTPELTKMVGPYDDSTTALDCYQVPKEVGKVGVESPSFIEPVTSRKDGIQAMFSKQKQKNELSSSSKEQPPPTSSPKRKREPTPSPSSPEADANTMAAVSDSPIISKKKVVGDDSNQPESAMGESVVPKPKASPTKRRKTKVPPGNKKIDSFFGRG